MNDGKQGMELIIDRVEALRVRIDHFRGIVGYDPVSLEHWCDLAKEALAEAMPMRALIDRITALLALPGNAPIADIKAAVEKVVRRCEQLEYKVIELENITKISEIDGKTVGDMIAPLHQRIEQLEAALKTHKE